MKNFPIQYTLQENDVLYFSHIPKTAGMTFRSILGDYFHCDQICPATINSEIAALSPQELQKYRLFRGYIDFTPERLPGKRIINLTILREPIARVISHYEFIRRTPRDPRYDAVRAISLEEFTRGLSEGSIVKNVQTYRVAKAARSDLEGLTPQEVLEIAKASLDQFALVGFVEQFQDALFLLSYVFGWKPILNSRKENVARSKKSGEELSPDTLAAIQENTQLDTELYTYAQSIFKGRYQQMQQELLANYADRLPVSSGHFSSDHSTSIETSSLTPKLTFQLLEKHYEQRYADLQIKPSSALIYDFCQPIRGTGWQRRQHTPESPAFRWTGPEPESTLDLPLAADQDLTIECRIIKAVSPEVLNSLKVEANGQPIQATNLAQTGSIAIWQGMIPQAAISTDRPFTQLTFKVDRTQSLQTLDPNQTDTRPVGLAVDLIQLFPAHTQPQVKTIDYVLNAEAWQSAVTFLSKHLFDAQPWNEAATFLEQQLGAGQKLLAPPVFGLKFPTFMLRQGINPLSQTQFYDPASLDSPNLNWVVVHKGMIDEVSPIVGRLFSLRFAPVFANEVFVIFAKNVNLPALNYTSSHVRSLYTSYFKFSLQQKTKPLSQLLKRFNA